MRLKSLFLLLLITLHFTTKSQDTLKVGLCLSGGGAKGLAHVGLLKLIDSLGIRVDYVTGTSMGSIIGGLYASGYTGNQIDSLIKSADWDRLLAQYVPMNQIYADEKDEYRRYIGELPINNDWKIHVTGVIEGQELLNFLIRLTRHVSHLEDFSRLPIPFKCVGVDVVSIKPVVLDRGSLAIAMRASMAIPTVFKPVKIDGKLLVDGGVMVNFPVQELKDMGANFIIGSYTGGRLREEEELNTVDKLLLQTSMFYSINESKDDIEMCDIFSNLTEHMKRYGSGDFHKSRKIVEIGDRISRETFPQLVELAKRQKANGVSYKRPALRKKTLKVKVDSIAIDTLYNPHLRDFVLNRVAFEVGDSVTYRELDKSIRNIYGTRNFFKAFYSLEPMDNGAYTMKINLQEDFKYRIKGALHFDNELGSGIIVNVTARNLFGKPSRLVASVDLAEAPKYRFSYKKYIAGSKSSIFTEFFKERADLNTYDSLGGVSSVSRTNYSSFNMGLLQNIGMNSSLYTSLSVESYQRKPRYKNINPVLGIQEYSFEALSLAVGLKGVFHVNTLNNKVFPRSGVDLVLENKLVLFPVEESRTSVAIPYVVVTKREVVTQSGTTTVIDSSLYIHKLTVDDNVIFNPYNRFFGRYNHYIPLSPKLSFSYGLNAGFIFYKLWAMDTTGFAGYALSDSNPTVDNFYIGGAEQRSRTSSFIPLWGVKEGEYIINNFVMARLGVQWEVVPKLFITPNVAFAYGATDLDGFFSNMLKSSPFEGKLSYTSNGNYNMSVISSGFNIGYSSPLGPVNVNLSNVTSIKNTRVYFSVGYRF